jgi:hypothetical protein
MLRPMKEKGEPLKTGTWIVRRIPIYLMRRTRMAALTEGKTVRQLIVDLVDGHLTGLEKKGLLPKGKWRADG